MTLSIFTLRVYNLIFTVIVNQEDQSKRHPLIRDLRLSYMNFKIVVMKGTPNLLYRFLSSMTVVGFIREYIEYCRVMKDPLVCTSINLNSKMHKGALYTKLERALIETKALSGL